MTFTKCKHVTSHQHANLCGREYCYVCYAMLLFRHPPLPFLLGTTLLKYVTLVAPSLSLSTMAVLTRHRPNPRKITGTCFPRNLPRLGSLACVHCPGRRCGRLSKQSRVAKRHRPGSMITFKTSVSFSTIQRTGRYGHHPASMAVRMPSCLESLRRAAIF